MSLPSFIFLAANAPWVYALAQSLGAHAQVTAVRFHDWANRLRIKPTWPEEASAVRRATISLPPGYAGRLERMFRPLVKGLIRRETARLHRSTGAEPFVICPYPYLAPWVRDISQERLVYYNLDDYELYNQAEQIARGSWRMS